MIGRQIKSFTTAGRAGRTRREIIVAASAVAAVATLTGCADEIGQNYRIMVEDENGNVLGSGVWEWRESKPGWGIGSPPSYWDYEALPIHHPLVGKMYVIGGPNSGYGSFRARKILEAYQAVDSIPKVTFSTATEYGGVGVDGARHLARMTKRVELPRPDTPCVVQFGDERDPRSVRVVMTHSKTRPVEVDLRFFAQPTKEPVSTGILKHLPWLPQHMGLFIGTPTKVQNRDHLEASAIAGSSFLRRADREKIYTAQRSTKP
jgi:hypothetical protein